MGSSFFAMRTASAITAILAGQRGGLAIRPMEARSIVISRVSYRSYSPVDGHAPAALAEDHPGGRSSHSFWMIKIVLAKSTDGPTSHACPGTERMLGHWPGQV